MVKLSGTDIARCNEAMEANGISDVDWLAAWLEVNVRQTLLGWRSTISPYNEGTTLCIPHGSLLNDWISLLANMASSNDPDVNTFVRLVNNFAELRQWHTMLVAFDTPMCADTLARQYMFADRYAMLEAFKKYPEVLPNNTYGVTRLRYTKCVRNFKVDITDSGYTLHSNPLERVLELSSMQWTLFTESVRVAQQSKFTF